MSHITNLAITQIRARHPSAHTRGFYPAVRETLWRSKFTYEDPEELQQSPYLVHVEPKPPLSPEELRELWQDTYKPHFMPDLFEIDEPTHEFRLYEIEDTHPLTDHKLYEVVEWWCTIDDQTSWNVRLFVTDRYGLSEREIALPDIYFQMLGG